MVAAACLAAGCRLVTTPDDFIPYAGLCTECPLDAGVTRPPCPVFPAGVTDTGHQTYTFAWRSVSLGAHAPDAGTYDIGRDQDCSPRAYRGLPTACTALPPDPVGDSGVVHLIAPPPRWEALPGGVDNSLGQRVLVPLLKFADSTGQPFDVDAILSERLDAGLFGQIVQITDWNGLPDDPAITAVFGGADGTYLPDGGHLDPKWDGTDVWRPSSDLKHYPHFTGYVSGGQLVVDTRDSIVESIQVTLTDQSGLPHVFAIQGRQMVRVGELTQEHLTLVSYGRWDLADALAQTNEVAAFLSGDSNLDGGIGGELANNLPPLFRAAADLPLGRAATVDQPCTALSLALRAEAFPVVAGAPSQ